MIHLVLLRLSTSDILIILTYLAKPIYSQHTKSIPHNTIAHFSPNILTMTSLDQTVANMGAFKELPVELLIPIFENISDMQSVYSTAASCKGLNDVFQTYRSTILAKLARNLLREEGISAEAVAAFVTPTVAHPDPEDVDRGEYTDKEIMDITAAMKSYKAAYDNWEKVLDSLTHSQCLELVRLHRFVQGPFSRYSGHASCCGPDFDSDSDNEDNEGNNRIHYCCPFETEVWYFEAYRRIFGHHVVDLADENYRRYGTWAPELGTFSQIEAPWGVLDTKFLDAMLSMWLELMRHTGGFLRYAKRYVQYPPGVHPYMNDCPHQSFNDRDRLEHCQECRHLTSSEICLKGLSTVRVFWRI